MSEEISAAELLESNGILGIEYAHVYTDQQFSKQHRLGIAELHRLPDGVVSSRVVLVDDYSTGVSIDRFDMTAFLLNLQRNDAVPDVVVLESEIAHYCGSVIDSISDSKLKRRIVSYYRTRGRYPCSALVATWYLLRLGAFGNPIIPCIYGRSDKLYSDALLTILPDCFVTSEVDALNIIAQTDYSSMTRRIEHIYFEHQEDVHSDWDDFDAEEYVARNYGRSLLAEDRQIIEFVISALQEMTIEPVSTKIVADIGVGPNLYPALLASPLIPHDGTIELIDIAERNLAYLRAVIEGENNDHSAVWEGFEEYIRSLGYPADLGTVRRSASVRKGNIYELEPNRYDMVMSFFVGESITDRVSEFDRATTTLMASVKPNGLFVIAHMIGSRGYFAGSDTFFPAVGLTMDQIRQKYEEYGECRYRMIPRGGNVSARKGYKGMAVVVGQKKC
ncbi:hypothetical protein [Nocardia jejuensis]|uniref:hypothetical protein n=1 Tax=Nocardia jejuensis TaxID=328049 RepID=UPI001471D1F2|nr:hypothetical protein [Nocardia jejuensis]